MASLIAVWWFVQDVEELLQRVCETESAQELYRCGSALLQHLQRARQRRHDIVTQEMKAVMEERDASIFKVTGSDHLSLTLWVSQSFCSITTQRPSPPPPPPLLCSTLASSSASVVPLTRFLRYHVQPGVERTPGGSGWPRQPPRQIFEFKCEHEYF